MLFAYLAYGPRTDIQIQLKYSLFVLLRYVPSARDNVVLFTDAPHRYRGWPVKVVPLEEVTGLRRREINYHFILKPLVLMRALRIWRVPTLLLDADTYVTDGFEFDIHWKLRSGVMLNSFECNDPYPDLYGFRADLPHSGTYMYNPCVARMYNSGVIGVGPDAAPMLEDAVSLIEALVAYPYRAHTIEQFAVSEMLRLSGVKIHECSRYLVHYHRRSMKRYITTKIERLLPEDLDDFDIPRLVTVNAFEKFLHDMRNSLEKRGVSIRARDRRDANLATDPASRSLS